jgi:hypothetical protein
MPLPSGTLTWGEWVAAGFPRRNDAMNVEQAVQSSMKTLLEWDIDPRDYAPFVQLFVALKKIPQYTSMETLQEVAFLVDLSPRKVKSLIERYSDVLKNARRSGRVSYKPPHTQKGAGGKGFVGYAERTWSGYTPARVLL